jgi:DNA-binding transcriptional MerR regulator
MRIGEVAALAGVSTRAVRHYHQRGLLAEPARLANGYREYTLRDVVVLSRIRRLTELGLTLDEVRDALGDTRDLREVLVALDGDLAAQEERLRERRARLAELIARADLAVDDAVAPDLRALSDALAHGEGPSAARERELLALLDTVADPADRDRAVAAMRAAATPEGLAAGAELHRRLDDLVDADPTDPRVPALAADLVAAMPGELRRLTGPPGAFGDAVLAEFAPAQAEVVRQCLRLMSEEA